MWLLGCLSGVVLVVLLGGFLLWARFHWITKPDEEQPPLPPPRTTTTTTTTASTQPTSGTHAQDLPTNLRVVTNSDRRDNRTRARMGLQSEDTQLSVALTKPGMEKDIEQRPTKWMNKDNADPILMDIYKAETQESQKNRLEMQKRTKNSSHVELTLC